MQTLEIKQKPQGLTAPLNFQQLFSICWESWKKGLKEIESEYCYSEYLKPLLQIFDQASSEHTEAVRDEILKYLEDPVVMIRKRALDIYRAVFCIIHDVALEITKDIELKIV